MDFSQRLLLQTGIGFGESGCNVWKPSLGPPNAGSWFSKTRWLPQPQPMQPRLKKMCCSSFPPLWPVIATSVRYHVELFNEKQRVADEKAVTRRRAKMLKRKMTEEEMRKAEERHMKRV